MKHKKNMSKLAKVQEKYNKLSDEDKKVLCICKKSYHIVHQSEFVENNQIFKSCKKCRTRCKNTYNGVGYKCEACNKNKSLSEFSKKNKNLCIKCYHLNIMKNNEEDFNKKAINELNNEVVNKPEEEWKTLNDENFNNFKVSNYGRVLNAKNNELKGSLKGGYKVVNLRQNGKLRKFLIHRLVAEHFIPNPNNLKEVNHKLTKTNNEIWNLEWVTRTQNAIYSSKDVIRQKKMVKCIDPDTDETVRVYDKIFDAQNFDEFDRNKIADIVEGRTSNKLHGGFLWKKVIEPEPEENKDDGVEEEWTNLKDSKYEELKKYSNYQISNKGKVKNLKTKKLLLAHDNKRVNLFDDSKKSKRFPVSRLVLMAFNIENPNNFQCASHIDKDGPRYHLSNLQWGLPHEQKRQRLV